MPLTLPHLPAGLSGNGSSGPETHVYLSCLFFKERVEHFDELMAFFKEYLAGQTKDLFIILSDHLVEARFTEAIDNAPDVPPENGPGTHRAGFCTGI